MIGGILQFMIYVNVNIVLYWHIECENALVNSYQFVQSESLVMLRLNKGLECRKLIICP